MTLANRIRMIRISKGLSQEYVAEKLNISQPAYSKIERRAECCSFYTLQKIAVALEVSTPFLIDIECIAYLQKE